MADAGFNSSDIEFSDAEDTTTKRVWGAESIKKIIADSEGDRISSKKTLKQLKFQHGAPGTIASQCLWTERFNAFRTHTLKQSVDRPFSGADVIRFLDKIIAKVRPGDAGKPAPSVNLVTTAFSILRSYGEFRWTEKDGFKIGDHDLAHFKSFKDSAIKQNRLVNGLWRKKTWIGFVTLSRMIRAFLQHSLRHGAWNFDVVIAKCLSMVMIASLGCRNGDITRSSGYHGTEYMKYGDINIYLEAGAEPLVGNLRGIFSLHNVKGHKDVQGEPLMRYIDAMNDVNLIHMCPISLLLVHALRNGQVHGSTIHEVLNHTANQSDRRLKWVFPHRPVLAGIARKPSRCDLDVAAGTHQPLATIKQMGVIAGLLGRAYVHALRLGAIREVSHLTPRQSESGGSGGAATDETRQYAGHTHATAQSGVTDDYVGGASREYWNEIAEQSIVHRREPAFAAGGESLREQVDHPVTQEEILADIQKHLPHRTSDTLTDIERKTVYTRIRRERTAELMASAVKEPKTDQKTYPAPDPPSLLSKATPLQSIPVNVSHVSRPERPAADGACADPTAVLPRHEASDIVFLANVDPDLLDEDTLAAAEVSRDDLHALRSIINPDLQEIGAAPEEDDLDTSTALRDLGTSAGIHHATEEAASIVLGDEPSEVNMKSTTGWRTSNAEGWINGYARYNVIRNTQFANAWMKFTSDNVGFEDSIGQHSMRGNSRDAPSPFMFHCHKTLGCTYQTIKLSLLQQHESRCTESLVADEQEALGKAVLHCPEIDCDYTTIAGPRALEQHVSRQHVWTPRTCEHPGCESHTIFDTHYAYKQHQTEVHSGRWPSKCPHPGCQSKDATFKNEKAMAYHLEHSHDLSTAEARLPYMPARPPKLVWVPQTCLKDGCENTTSMRSKSRMHLHLTSAHSMSDEDADALIDERANYVPQVPKTRVLGTKGASKRQDKKRAFGKAGKEEGVAVAAEQETDLVEDHGDGLVEVPKKRRRGKGSGEV